MSATNSNTKWWELPIEQMPHEVRLEDMPPLLQSLVRRNADLRRRLLDKEKALKAAEPENVQKLDLENQILKTRIEALEQLVKTLTGQIDASKAKAASLEAKLENFRSMLQRRDEKIEKLKKK